MNQVLKSCFFLVIFLTFSQAEICSNGKSPIALYPATAIPPAEGKSVEFMYERSVMKIKMEIQDDTVVGSAGADSVFAEYLMLDGTKYNVKQLRLRWGESSSDGTEHSIGGNKHEGEIQFEHTKAEEGDDGPEMVIVSIPLNTVDGVWEETKQIYGFIKAFGLTTAAPIETTLTETKASMKSYIKGSFLKYTGTTTAGTCDKEVAWLVFEEPFPASPEYFATLRALKGANDKPLAKSTLKDLVTMDEPAVVERYETVTLLEKPAAK